MRDADLDNPFWSSLTTRHEALAQRAGDALRYPPEFAPFMGVPDAQADVEAALDGWFADDDAWLLLGVAPKLSPAWSLETFRPLAQMVLDAPLPVIDGPDVIELTEARHRKDALELVALVYPHYFRPRTMELGRYLGIYRDGRLAAMVGERLGTESAREISAVCTHPDHVGRGYARRLIALLANDQIARGWLPFLHVSQENTRACSLYREMGFRQRREIDFWALRRAPSA